MTKQAKLASQARLPDAAMPDAALTRFDSAMPTLKNRAGNFLAKKSVRVELWTSPSSTTTSANCSPTFARARPNASRVDLPIFMVRVFLNLNHEQGSVISQRFTYRVIRGMWQRTTDNEQRTRTHPITAN